MLLFSTILDIKDTVTKEDFVELAAKWNADSPYEHNIVPGFTWKGERSAKYGNEKLSMEVIDLSSENIMAIRHEKCGRDGTVWDTDLIVNFDEQKISVRLDRTYQEDAIEINGKFSTPHFISCLIQAGYLKEDQGIPITRDPIYVTDKDHELVRSFLRRIESYRLPVVYVSKTADNKDPVSLSWLSSRLKGAAHVLAEYSVEECSELRKLFNETPEEYGSVRIYYPSVGMKRKRFLYRSATADLEERLNRIIKNVIAYRNAQFTERLYTWQGVNRALLRETLEHQVQIRKEAEHAREHAENEISQVYETFDEDLKLLQDKLDEMTKENEALQIENQGLRAKVTSADAIPLLYQGDEEDFYPDEIKDLILGMLEDVKKNTPEKTRRADILKDVLKKNPPAHLSEERKKRVKDLFKGYKNLSGSMRQELLDLGIAITEDGKHYKLTLNGDPRYMVTIGKTPSDHRAGDNNASNVNKIMF